MVMDGVVCRYCMFYERTDTFILQAEIFGWSISFFLFFMVSAKVFSLVDIEDLAFSPSPQGKYMALTMRLAG